MNYSLHPRTFSDTRAHLMSLRGIDPHGDPVLVAAFLEPHYEKHTHSPWLLKGMREAVDMILDHIAQQKHIVIFSDYDADGIPGGVILHDFFRKIGYAHFKNYIPHRHHEGFGLNVEALRTLAAQGAHLIITVDCGIADIEPAKEAAKLGLKLIITDHHMPGPVLPAADIILNPKQADCAYPEKMLCGAAMAYKLVCALIEEYKKRGLLDAEGKPVKDGWEKWLLDMVGIGTLSDMVPLTGENRVLAYYGLLVLRKTPRIGLTRLCSIVGIKQRFMSEDDIGFSISPRINAASRMGHPMDAFLVLAATDEGEAALRAKHLDEINNERKGIVASMVKHIKSVVRERWNGPAAMPPVLVLGHTDWKPSLLGLAANTCAEEYGRPVFLWGRDGEGLVRGSCRSGGHQSVHALMHAVDAASPGTFAQFGGHEHSGGFACSVEKAVFLETLLTDAAEKSKAEKGDAAEGATAAGAVKMIDVEIQPHEFAWALYDAMAPLAPFGVGNPKPLFLIRGAQIVEVRTFGRDNAHLEIIFEAPSMPGGNAKAIAFFKGKDPSAAFSAGHALTQGGRAVLIGTLEKSFFKMRPELRLRLEDVTE